MMDGWLVGWMVGWMDGWMEFMKPLSLNLRFNQFEVEDHFWQFLDAVRGVSVSFQHFFYDAVRRWDPKTTPPEN